MIFRFNSKVVFIWQLLGIAPVNLAARKVSSWLFVASLILYLGLGAVFNLNVLIDFNKHKNNATIVTIPKHVVNILDSLSTSYVATSFILYSYRSWSLLLELSPGFARIDRILPSPPPGWLATLSMCYFGTQVAIAVGNGWFWVRQPRPNLATLPFFVFQLVIAAGVHHFVTLLIIIKRKFMVWNQHFEELVRFHPFTLRWNNDILTITHMSHIHLDMISLTRSINQAYGPQLLATMIFFLFRFVIIPYRCLVLLRAHELQYEYVVYQILWMISYLLRLWFLLWVCTNTQNEANKITEIVNKYINKKLPPATYQELHQLITTQAYLRRLTLTAGNNFDLNYSFLATVVHSTTTYLTFLVTMKSAMSGE